MGVQAAIDGAEEKEMVPDVGNGEAVGIASPLRDMFEEWKRGGGGT